MFQIFEIQGRRFEYSNIIRSPKFSNPNPNIRDSRKKIRIRIESEYIRSSLACTAWHNPPTCTHPQSPLIPVQPGLDPLDTSAV